MRAGRRGPGHDRRRRSSGPNHRDARNLDRPDMADGPPNSARNNRRKPCDHLPRNTGSTSDLRYTAPVNLDARRSACRGRTGPETPQIPPCFPKTIRTQQSTSVMMILARMCTSRREHRGFGLIPSGRILPERRCVPAGHWETQGGRYLRACRSMRSFAWTSRIGLPLPRTRGLRVPAGSGWRCRLEEGGS